MSDERPQLAGQQGLALDHGLATDSIVAAGRAPPDTAPSTPTAVDTRIATFTVITVRPR